MNKYTPQETFIFAVILALIVVIGFCLVVTFSQKSPVTPMLTPTAGQGEIDEQAVPQIFPCEPEDCKG